MDIPKPRPHLLLTACAALLLFHTHAQHDPVWAIGDRALSFGGVEAPGLTSAPLPRPNDPSIPALLQYNGQVAERMQHAEYDAEGKLLFFMIDGAIYNANGYRIVDTGTTPADRNCRECFYAGQEVHVFPRPGSCSQYFVISIYSASNGEPIEPPALPLPRNYMRVGVLDLTVVNGHPDYADATCSVRGGFLHETQRPGIGLLEDVQLYEPIAGDLVEEEDVVGYCAEGIVTSTDAGSGMMRGATLQLENDPRGLMCVITEQRMATLVIEQSGLRRLDTPEGFNGHPITWYGPPGPNGSEVLNSVDDNDGSFRGEMAMRQVGTEIRVAYSQYVRFRYTPAGPEYHQPRIAVWEFQVFPPTEPDPTSLGFTMVPLDQPDPNPKTYAPDLYPFDTPTPPTDFLDDVVAVPAIGGLEFSPNGRYLYFTKSAQGTPEFPSNTFGYVDLNVPCTPGVNCPAFFYPEIGGQTVGRKLVDTQLDLNVGPDGTTPALYMLGADALGAYWLAAFSGLDDPTTGTWQQQAIDLNTIAYRTAPDGTIHYRLLNRRVAGSTHFATLQTTVCCEDLALLRDRSTTIAPTTDLWAPGDNPFCDTEGPVYLAQDLVIPSGAVVTMNHMDFRFGHQARLIIQRGAKVTANNSTFTSLCERWPGIRVEGNTTNPYQGNNPNLPLAQEQGQLNLDHCTVANARTGVWCARETSTGTVDAAYHGGYVQAFYTTFRNNLTGAHVANYQRTEGAGTVLDNKTRFAGCSFITDATWPDLGTSVPQRHVRLAAVHGVRFSFCVFANQAPELFASINHGRGIDAYRAGFHVTGADNPATGAFENLYLAIRSAPGSFETYSVDNMHFVKNRWGIYDLASVAARLTRNTFTVPDAGDLLAPTLGILLHESTLHVVEENSFQGNTAETSFGIYFLGTQQADNQIYNNEFVNLMAGTMVAGRHKGNEVGYEDQGLQILCGDYLANTYDLGLASYSYIREDQGTTEGNPTTWQLAGNRWLDPADGSSFDIWIDPEQHTGTDPDYPQPYFDYKRHDVLECDPLTTSEFFTDQPQDGFDAFDKEVACGKGDFVPPSGGHAQIRADYVSRSTELASAVSHFRGTVNSGIKEETLIDAVNEKEPPYSSHALRDHLIGNSPLTDPVLVAMVLRETPMDQWHLVQVLVANKPLSNQVFNLVTNGNYVTPYQKTLIEGGSQAGQVHLLLKQEIMGLARTKARLQRHMLHQLLTDSTELEVRQTYWNTLGAAPDLADHYLLHASTLLEGDPALAQVWLDSITAIEPKEVSVLQMLMALRDSLGTAWPVARPQDWGMLEPQLDRMDPGVSWAWALAYEAELTDAEPVLPLPDLNKARRTVRRASTQDPMNGEANAVQVFPNPASGHTFVVMPNPPSGPVVLRMIDATGRIMSETQHHAALEVIELDLGGLAAGIYACEILGGSMEKQTVQVVVR